MAMSRTIFILNICFHISRSLGKKYISLVLPSAYKKIKYLHFQWSYSSPNQQQLGWTQAMDWDPERVLMLSSRIQDLAIFLYPTKTRSSYKTELQMRTCKLSESCATGIWVDLLIHFRFSMLFFSHSVPTCFCNFWAWTLYNNEYSSRKRMVYKPKYIYISSWQRKKNPKGSHLLNSKAPFCEMSQKSPSLRWLLDLQKDQGELRKVVFGCFKFTMRIIIF